MRDIINVATLNDEHKHNFMQIDNITANQKAFKKGLNLQTSTNTIEHINLPRKFKRRQYLSQRNLYGIQPRANTKHRSYLSNRENIHNILATQSSIEPINHLPKCGLINLSFFRILFFGIFISGGDVFSDFLQVWF